MRSEFSLFAALPLGCWAAAIRQAAPESFVGYLMTGFYDATHDVEQFISRGNDPLNFRPLNDGNPILSSDVGTQGVRDQYVTTNPERSVYYMVATDLDINVPGFSWSEATRVGSRGLVVWKSTDLIDWEGPTMPIVETPTAGMLWAPSCVYNEQDEGWDIFWSSQHYQPDDVDHTGSANFQRIRTSFTKDFATFTEPVDYHSLPTQPIIDQEFQYLGEPGHYVRFLKNVTTSQVFAEHTTDGLDGTWTRLPGNANDQSPSEGALAYADNLDSGKYYLWLDDYVEYIAYETSDILGNAWEPASQDGIPPLIKHGAVLPVTQEEYDRIVARYPE